MEPAHFSPLNYAILGGYLSAMLAVGVLFARRQKTTEDYFLGGHPLWQVARSTFQLAKKPYIVGGLALLAGYVWCWITGVQRPVSKELMAFHRGEQMARLRGLVFDRLGIRRADPQDA